MKMKLNVAPQAGWIVAAALGAFVVTTGFQDNSPKFGVVDMNKVMNDATAGKKLKDDLQSQFNDRQGLLEFVAANPTLTSEQANKLRELSLKSGATAAEKTEVENLKKLIVADFKRYEALGQKQTITEKERADLEDLGSRRKNAGNLLQRWQQDFANEITNHEADQQNLLAEKVKKSVTELSKKQGYSLVFQTSSAIYGANDLTADSIKAVDAAQ